MLRRFETAWPLIEEAFRQGQRVIEPRECCGATRWSTILSNAPRAHLRLEVHEPENRDLIANDPGAILSVQGYAGHLRVTNGVW